MSEKIWKYIFCEIWLKESFDLFSGLYFPLNDFVYNIVWMHCPSFDSLAFLFLYSYRFLAAHTPHNCKWQFWCKRLILIIWQRWNSELNSHLFMINENGINSVFKVCKVVHLFIDSCLIVKVSSHISNLSVYISLQILGFECYWHLSEVH